MKFMADSYETCYVFSWFYTKCLTSVKDFPFYWLIDILFKVSMIIVHTFDSRNLQLVLKCDILEFLNVKLSLGLCKLCS